MRIMLELFFGFVGGVASTIIFLWVVEHLEKEERRIKAQTQELSDKTAEDILRELEAH